MKIVYVITRSDSIAGAQHHVHDLALAMQNRGHEVHILVGGDGPFTKKLSDSGLAFKQVVNLVRPVSPVQDFKCIRELRQYFSSHQVDLVHCHSSKAGLIGRYAAYRCQLPNIFSAHGWSFAEGIKPIAARVYEFLERRAAKWCDKILCGSENDRQLGLAKNIGDESKIETSWYGIPNLPDNAMANPAASPVKMVMVARFEEQKDHQTLIQALGMIKDLDWSIDLLGDGPLRARMEQLASELGVRERINFAGAQPTRDYLLTSQILLLISNWEGLPLSTLEGMRVGLPLIGSDVGGMSEEITENVSGFLVRRGSVDQTADRIRKLIGNPDMRADFGRQGKARFDADFQYSKMVDRIENIYQRVIQSHRNSKERNG